MVMRRMMMGKAEGSSPIAPLYPFDDRSYSATGQHETLSNGNISITTSSNSRNYYFGKNRTSQSTAHSTGWLTWFTWYAGDVVTIKCKNITYTGSGSGSNYCNVTPYTSGGVATNTTKISFGSGAGTKEDIENTFTVQSEEVPINCIRCMTYRSVSPLTFDLEIWVNGQRYV